MTLVTPIRTRETEKEGEREGGREGHRDVSPTPRLKNTAEREGGDSETRRRGETFLRHPRPCIHVFCVGGHDFCIAFCEGGGTGGERGVGG